MRPKPRLSSVMTRWRMFRSVPWGTSISMRSHFQPGKSCRWISMQENWDPVWIRFWEFSIPTERLSWIQAMTIQHPVSLPPWIPIFNFLPPPKGLTSSQ
jgi:hypothetical protein